MAADTWTVHNAGLEYMLDNTVSLEGDTMKMRLYTSASGINSATVSDASTESANEVANANGYVTGGTAVTVSVTRSGGVVTVTSTDGNWTAAGGTITARYAAIIDETTTPDTVLFSTVLDNTPADVQALDTNVFSVQIHPNGIATVQQV